MTDYLVNDITIASFLAKVEKGVTEGDCWIWLGGSGGHKYSWFSAGFGDGELAHRFSFRAFKGSIPENYTIDHLCRNRSCTNPRHLEAVTHQENLLRGVGIAAINAKKTHCNKGHEFTKENLLNKSNGSRCCKICSREHNKKYKLFKKNLPDSL